jgi:hypothetical protein
MKKTCCIALLLGAATLAQAKLPAPSDEAKAKAAEAAAKTAWTAKVDAYALCKAQDKTALTYAKSAKDKGQPVAKPATPLPACADPGPFVYPVPTVAAPAMAAPAAKAPAAATPAAPGKAPAATPAAAPAATKKP